MSQHNLAPPTVEDLSLLRAFLDYERDQGASERDHQRRKELYRLISTALSHGSTPDHVAARKACAVEIERRRIARLAPCERGVPAPETPKQACAAWDSLTGEEQTRRIEAYQRRLEIWHGA